jgi:hypothetical protein
VTTTVALGGELLCDAPADALACAGDDRDLVVEPSHVLCLGLLCVTANRQRDLDVLLRFEGAYGARLE